jgi:hypothetical protein
MTPHTDLTLHGQQAACSGEWHISGRERAVALRAGDAVKATHGLNFAAVLAGMACIPGHWGVACGLPVWRSAVRGLNTWAETIWQPGYWQNEQRVVRQQGSGSVCSNVRLCQHVMAGCAAALHVAGECEQCESGVCRG